MTASQFPLFSVRQNAEQLVNRADYKMFSCIELCRVTAVDTNSKTVSAFFLDSRINKERVPYAYPSYNGGSGIIIVPMVDSIGVAAWDINGLPIILTFTAPLAKDEINMLTRNLPHLKGYNLPDLLEGEVLISSGGRSFIKFDSVGGVHLSSSLFASIYLDENGNGTIDLENGYFNINGVVEEVYTDNFIPVLKVVKGKHLYSPTQCDDDSVELCYRVSVMDDQDETAFIGIDTHGNIHVKGQIIRYQEVENTD